MKINHPVTQNEIAFPDNQILVSTTDLQGVITSVNPAFVTISGFSENELIGHNHNVVRHPDMPEEAFEWLWRDLKAGKTWSGVVKNRAKNGDFYWVDASVTPIMEKQQIVGYLSVRSKPSPQQIDEAARLYADIKAKRIANPFKPRGMAKAVVTVKNITLKTRILSTIVLVICVCGGLLGLSQWGMMQLHNLHESVVADSNDAMQMLETSHIGFELYSVAADAVINGYSKEIVAEWQAIKQTASQEKAKLRALNNGTAEREHLEQGFQALGAFIEIVDRELLPAIQKNANHRVSEGRGRQGARAPP